MPLGIALLQGGSFVDLAASMQAVALGKRTNSVVHAILLGNAVRQEEAFGFDRTAESTPPGYNELLGLTTWLGSVEGVQVQSHVMENADDHALIEFICVHRVFCLVAGARDHEARKDKKAWAEGLRDQLTKENRWYLPSFWSIIIEPWDDSTVARIIAQLKQPLGYGMARENMAHRCV